MAGCELGSGRSRYLSQGDFVIDAPLLVPSVPLLVDELDAQAAKGQLPDDSKPAWRGEKARLRGNRPRTALLRRSPLRAP